MQHLDTDRLAALADEAPTAEETAHLATCVVCRRERAEFVELLAMARREGAAGLAPDAIAAAPPLSSWDAISTTLRAEGLIRSPAAASAPARPAATVASLPVRNAASVYWRRAAASLALLVGGAALGRASAPTVVAVGPAPAPAAVPTTQVAAATPTPSPAATTPPVASPAGRGISDTIPVYGEPSAQLASHADDAVGFHTVDEAMAVLTRAQRDYQRAGAWLADHDSTSLGNSPQTLKARLAALDEVLPKFREALHEAPQDPVLNQYYLTAADVRESTLRQLGRALPVGRAAEQLLMQTPGIRSIGAAVALLAGVSPAVAQVVVPSTTPVAACAPAGLLRRPALGALPGDSDDGGATRRLFEMREMLAAAAGGARAGGPPQGLRIALSRGWLGLSTEEITERRIGPDGMRVRYCDYPVVVSVQGASPAQRAGLEPGDTIVAYNDVDLRDGGEFMWDHLFVPDSTVRVSVRRDGRPMTLPLVVGRLPSDVSITQVFRSSGGAGYGFVVVNPEPGAIAPTSRSSADAPAPRVRVSAGRARRDDGDPLVAPTARLGQAPLVFGMGFNGMSAIAGAQLMAMDDDLRQVVGAKNGVLVLKVADGSPASEAGLRAGDVIVTAGGAECTTPVVVQRALLQNRDERALPLKVERRGKTREVTLRW